MGGVGGARGAAALEAVVVVAEQHAPHRLHLQLALAPLHVQRDVLQREAQDLQPLDAVPKLADDPLLVRNRLAQRHHVSRVHTAYHHWRRRSGGGGRAISNIVTVASGDTWSRDHSAWRRRQGPFRRVRWAARECAAAVAQAARHGDIGAWAACTTSATDGTPAARAADGAAGGGAQGSQNDAMTMRRGAAPPLARWKSCETTYLQ